MSPSTRLHPFEGAMLDPSSTEIMSPIVVCYLLSSIVTVHLLSEYLIPNTIALQPQKERAILSTVNTGMYTY